MGISVEEQEIVIQASRDKEMATVYVTDRTYMTKLDKLVANKPHVYKMVKEHLMDGEIIGKTYEFPKKLISFRSDFSKGREWTEEEKEKRTEKLLEGLNKWREEQKNRK